MQLILLGLPGVGKGTQAKVLASHLGLLHISTGDMFRDAAEKKTSLGLSAQEFMSKGQLVPDEVTINMLLERISENDAQKGIMLDGFPRTIPQAKALDEALKNRNSPIDAVLYIKVPEVELLARLTGRWTCSECGEIYHTQTNPPKKEELCDLCDGVLSQRADDQPDTVSDRLNANREWTEQLVTYYEDFSKLHSIDGTGEMEEITERLISVIEMVSAER
ncbi:MAG: adenylate kinase [Chloroflexi bacterium]|mgnify:CR=1 FL=1|nr:adenylate kinase [Chloroflexota bacterium]|tara:strand:- start:1752 stop:2411 length:660 start_codon:yes stop_codon:yes gene_type:complete